MARRYTRVLQFDRCTEDTVDEHYDALTDKIDALYSYHFQPGSWHVTDGAEHNLLDVVITKDTFQGKLGVHRAADLEMNPGCEPVRTFNAKVSAECCNLKRQRAREMELGGQHKLGAVFGVIGGIIACGLWTLLQIIALDGILVGRASLIYVGVFVLGSAIGGALGTIIGGKIGKTVGSAVSQSSHNEEHRFDDAVAAWEEFIEVLGRTVDEFGETVEETPSKATVI